MSSKKHKYKAHQNQGKTTRIKAINQKPTVKKQKRTHHCSNNQEVTEMQKKIHETSDSSMRNSRKEDCNHGHKKHVANYFIKGRDWAALKHYKNIGCNHCRSNLSEEIFTFQVSIVLLWLQNPFLPYIIARSVTSAKRVDFILSPLPSSYPVHSPHIPPFPPLLPLSDPLQRKASVMSIFWSLLWDLISIEIQRKIMTECLIWTSNKHSFAPNSIARSALPSLYRITFLSSL